MFEELGIASSLLRTALDRYLEACNGVRNYYLQSGSLASIPSKFTDHVGNEVSSLPSLEEKLQKAKLLINWSHNCSAISSPINLLPPEILLSIFQLVISSEQCLNHAPSYPDTLVHVCSRWRYIAMNWPTLWSHVNLLTSKIPVPEGIIERAQAYADRAGKLPLEVHLPISSKQADAIIIENLSQLLSESTIAPRARSLDIGFGREPKPSDPIPHPVSKLFGNSTPGTLTRLAMYCNTVRGGGLFIGGQGQSEQSFESSPLLLSVPQEHLDSVLLGITSLQLRLIYFPWTSPAYHGLLELCLTGYQDCVSITESQLTNMLEACPRLRTLEFGLHILRESPHDAPIVPIQLADLEVLNLSMSLRDDVDFLLRCLVPGSRPLQLSLSRRYSTTAIGELIDSIQPFLNRSNMTTLHATKFDFFCVSALVGVSPQLQTLAIERLEQGPSINSYKTRAGSVGLESLYLLDSYVTLEDLVKFLAWCPTQKLVLWRAKFNSDSYSGGQVLEDTVLQELSRVCADVQWLSDSSINPTKAWDLFLY